MKLTPTSLQLISSGFLLILVGILFGNMVIIYLGSTPIIFLILVLVVGEVRDVTVNPVSEGVELLLGDIVTLERDVFVRGGVGLISLHEELPPHFKLAEGNNLRLFFKGLKDLHIHLSCKVECTRRGVYKLEKLHFGVRHVFGLLEPRRGFLKLNQLIIVRSPFYKIRKVRERRQVSLLPIPAESQIKMGVDTTDFKEIREYTFGDSYKKINWKATSRSLQFSRKLPVVNEYEREGRRVVYIFLNCSHSMALGTSLMNSFEYGIQAALSITQFYLDRQSLVGFSLYNEDQAFISTTPLSEKLKALYESEGTRVMADLVPDSRFASLEKETQPETHVEARSCNVFPDSGRNQLFKIRRLLQSAGLGTSTFNLSQSFRFAQSHLKSLNPLLIFITRVQPSTAEGLRSDMIQMQKYLRKTNLRKKNMLLFNVSGFGLASKTEEDTEAAIIMRLEERKLIDQQFSDFAMVYNWSPDKATLLQALSAQVKGR